MTRWTAALSHGLHPLAGPLLAGLNAVLSRRGGGRLSVLYFHRVLPAPDPMRPEEIEAETFRRLLSLVTRHFRVLPLGEAWTRLERGELPPRALALTFDDGYRDNVEVALPLLRRHGVAATFFVAGGFLEGGHMWNDTVIEAVRRAPGAELDLSHAGLGVHRLPTPDARRRAAGDLIRRLKHLPGSEREEKVAAVAETVGPERLPGDLMMREEDLRFLSREGMSIGAHTLHHPILARVSRSRAEQEIGGSRELLEGITGEPVSLFAYPNGRPGQDYGPEHVAMVRRAGFRLAAATLPGTAGRGTDPLQLPRFTPWRRDPLGFHALLARNYLERVRTFGEEEGP